MPLFFESKVYGPATHVLVIGVGGYRHLEGGTGIPIDDALQYGNLGQLTSPPRSALAFASFLRDSTRDHWKAPLATIDLLVSLAPADAVVFQSGIAFNEPTIDNIASAFDDWRGRCSSNADNVAIFYFCGHGLQGNEQLLLASDFGKFSGNHFKGAFAFDSTRNGFLQSAPNTQCFFIDACREVTPGAIENLGGAPALPLVSPRAYKPRQCKHDLTIQSSAPFENAFAPVKGISYFTSALLKALAGGAATTDEYGDWVIRTDGVTSRIDELLWAESGRDQPTAKGPGLNPTVIYRLDSPPDTKLILECDPRLALAVAALSCETSPPPGARYERMPPAPTAWELIVRAGYYTINASFIDGAFRNASRTVLVTPPSSPHRLKVAT